MTDFQSSFAVILSRKFAIKWHVLNALLLIIIVRFCILSFTRQCSDTSELWCDLSNFFRKFTVQSTNKIILKIGQLLMKVWSYETWWLSFYGSPGICRTAVTLICFFELQNGPILLMSQLQSTAVIICFAYSALSVLYSVYDIMWEI